MRDLVRLRYQPNLPFSPAAGFHTFRWTLPRFGNSRNVEMGTLPLQIIAEQFLPALHRVGSSKTQVGWLGRAEDGSLT
jgi:hypothetical protein